MDYFRQKTWIYVGSHTTYRNVHYLVLAFFYFFPPTHPFVLALVYTLMDGIKVVVHHCAYKHCAFQ